MATTEPASVQRAGWRDRLGAPLRESRGLAALELLIIPIVLGLRAAGVIRNPVLLFLAFGWLSLWLRRSGWKHVGLARPTHWPRTLLLGAAIGIAYDALDIYVLLPLIRHVTGEPLDLSELSGLQGNLPALLGLLAAVWTLFAFGEELAYRGYLLNRAFDAFGRNLVGIVAGVALVSAAFGLAHWGQGASGIVDNAIGGAVLAVLYLASGRNLWLPIIAHGVEDTLSLLLLFFGFRPPA